MRSPAFSVGRPKLVILVLISACALFLLSSLSSLTSQFRWTKKVVGASEKPYETWDTKPFIKHNGDPAQIGISTICAGFPKTVLDNVQVVLKIGASEDMHKVHANLETVTACFENLLIFSDFPDRIEQHEVIDILADLPASYHKNNPDWAVYEAQKEAKEKGTTGGPGIEGWKLDRFKFLPMVEKSYALRPDAAWYIYLEADTYISWDNLFRFLDHFDPESSVYMGSPVPGSYGRWFAHGGSGIVLSNGALKKFLARETDENGDFIEPSVGEKFEGMAKSDCCGDAVLAYAMVEKGIRLSGYFPLFNGDNSEGMRLTEDKWCMPITTLHHINQDEMHALWTWEMRRTNVEKPMLYSDIFHFIFGSFPSSRSDWDNFSGLPAPNSGKVSFDACAAACYADQHCVQYLHSNDHCSFERVLRRGHPRGPEGNNKFISGWDINKLKKMTARECDVVQWPTASVARHD